VSQTEELHVALLAPPWLPVPPSEYGGIEAVLAEVASGLTRRGVEVTLLAAPGSDSPADVVELLDRTHPKEMGDTLVEVDHLACALEEIDAAAARGEPFSILHDHSGFALFAVADRVGLPVLHTLHGPFAPDSWMFYRRHAGNAWVSGLSESQLADAPADLRAVGAIPNPIDVAAWPMEPSKGEHVVWVGRMTTVKGPQRAIAAAREAGRPLVLAGPVQPGSEEFFEAEVAPHIDGDRVRYIEEVGGEDKKRLFAGAAALLMPIRWAEPFGMVMTEAMVCGTPVVAFPEGAAKDILIDGENGFLVDDEAEMAAALQRLSEIDPDRCRASVERRYDTGVVAAAYEDAYRRVIAAEALAEPAPSRPTAL
jgi:glycosyltransferase involved in cell wall biosynthesis